MPILSQILLKDTPKRINVNISLSKHYCRMSLRRASWVGVACQSQTLPANSPARIRKTRRISHVELRAEKVRPLNPPCTQTTQKALPVCLDPPAAPLCPAPGRPCRPRQWQPALPETPTSCGTQLPRAWAAAASWTAETSLHPPAEHTGLQPLCDIGHAAGGAEVFQVPLVCVCALWAPGWAAATQVALVLMSASKPQAIQANHGCVQHVISAYLSLDSARNVVT